MSSLTGMGVEQLYNRVIKVTLQQPYMGEMIPESFLAGEKAMIHKRGTQSFLTWSEVESQVCAIVIINYDIRWFTGHHPLSAAGI